MPDEPPRLRAVYKLVYPPGTVPPDQEHFKQSMELMLRLYELAPEARDLFCRSLLFDQRCLAGRMYKEANQGKIKLTAAILKHHPPRKSERDAEIVRLDAEGKSSGQIANLITPRFGATNSSTVRSVLRRKKKPTS